MLAEDRAGRTCLTPSSPSPQWGNGGRQSSNRDPGMAPGGRAGRVSGAPGLRVKEFCGAVQVTKLSIHRSRRARMREGCARVDQRFAEFQTKLTKRLFAFWVTQAATTVGLVLGVATLLR